jgi:hypothetical protein
MAQVNGLPLKNDRMVEYGQLLDLRPCMAPDALDAQAAAYALQGIIVHEGVRNSTSSGHYVAHVRARDGSWWECNDGQVGERTALTLTCTAARL